MFEELDLSSVFGPVAAGAIRLSFNGKPAVRTDSGYRTFNAKTKKFLNVTSMCLDPGNMFSIFPTRKLAEGDLVLVNGRFKGTISANSETVKALDYGTGIIEEFVPEHYPLTGQKFYGKVVSVLDFLQPGAKRNSFMNMMIMLPQLGLTNSTLGNSKEQNPFAAMMMIQFLQNNLLSGGDAESEDCGLGFSFGDDSNGMLKMALLSQCFGNGSNPFCFGAENGGNGTTLGGLLSAVMFQSVLSGSKCGDNPLSALFQDEEPAAAPEVPKAPEAPATELA